jgi:hypothetical protein
VLLNELAQWAVLLFIAVFVLGLTRQLGNFIMPKGERVDLDIGPPIGDRLSEPLFSVEEGQAIRDLITASPVDWGAVVVLHDQCTGCSALLERVRRKGRPRGAVMVALTRDEEPRHVDKLRRLSDMTIADGRRLDEAELFTAPFALLVDSDLQVLHKDVTPDLHQTVTAWLEQRAEFEAAAEWRADHPDSSLLLDADKSPELVKVEGRSSE